MCERIGVWLAPMGYGCEYRIVEGKALSGVASQLRGRYTRSSDAIAHHVNDAIEHHLA